MGLKEGTLVRAKRTIVEGKIGVARADAPPYEEGWVYAEPGDIGIVEYECQLDSGQDYPTVRFARTGTASSVFAELELETLS